MKTFKKFIKEAKLTADDVAKKYKSFKVGDTIELDEGITIKITDAVFKFHYTGPYALISFEWKKDGETGRDVLPLATFQQTYFGK